LVHVETIAPHPSPLSLIVQARRPSFQRIAAPWRP
jgi:hypothetical protein